MISNLTAKPLVDSQKENYMSNYLDLLIFIIYPLL